MGRNVWAAVVVACAAMIVVAVMAIFHVDKDTIFLVASVLATPVLAALVVGQQASTQATTAAIAQQTNGTQTKMLQMLEAQGQLLARMAPEGTSLVQSALAQYEQQPEPATMSQPAPTSPAGGPAQPT